MAKGKNRAQTFAYIKTGLSTIFSNKACIESAKTLHWVIPVIIFLVSIFISTLPILVSSVNASGSGFLATYNKGFDTSCAYFCESLKNNNVDQVIADNKLVFNNWEKTYGNSSEIQYAHINQNTHEYDFIAFYFDINKSQMSEFVDKNLAARYYVSGTTTKASEKGDATYSPSYMVFGRENYALVVYNPSSNTTFGSTYGDYCYLNGENLRTYAEGFENYPIANYKDEVEVLFNNFRTYLDKGYLNAKNQGAGFSIGLSLGINAALTLFMGLMLWILTRGKNNPYRGYSLWLCEKISGWASFSPALIAMVLGFLFSSNAMIFYIMLFGLRAMWLSMKQLRPQY